MMVDENYGVNRIYHELHHTLESYLEALYHIKDISLIKERHQLLNKPGSISQRPYVESTPIYQPGRGYSTLDIPLPAKEILIKLSEMSPGVSIFPTPYVHQSDALEAFFDRKEDLIIATGTGSGKTESFLMPIIGELAIESVERPQSAKMHGCRALLLYPMNALVNDQLGRIRKLFGDERVADLLKIGRGRLVSFGSYTGRTPYPGKRLWKKDKYHLQPLFEDFYLKYIKNEKKVAQLREKGKWPAKDLIHFYGADKIEQNKNGRKKYNWDQRFQTQPGDRELLTRDEMQNTCPDILITNYSMLEYMLMRPIEHKIFLQTKQWLASDSRNQLILVLDEAHMYRGAAGAEVALLIRRFQSRLNISRERLRCILTSASLGDKSKANEEAVIKFARDLTGLAEFSSQKFNLIQGKYEVRSGARQGRAEEASALALFDLAAFHQFYIDPHIAVKAVRGLADRLSWPAFLNPSSQLEQYLFDNLSGFGVAEELIRIVSGQAVELNDLSQRLFPIACPEEREKATETLIALTTFAKRQADGRILLPTRLHLFYRGLPALYTCINLECNARLDSEQRDHYLLGRMYTEPRLHCDCDSHARVFELLTHRQCGAAFIRGYVYGRDGKFLLHEPDQRLGQESPELKQPLYELHLLVDGEPHVDAMGQYFEVWLDIVTGQMERKKPSNTKGYLRCFRSEADPVDNGGRPLLSFPSCPICLKRFRGDRTKIMDLRTKGEAPFANLVKSQLILQPPREVESLECPNGGRKVLLFSDGRQKAARLARDIPREVEHDSFRRALALAAERLQKIQKKAPKLTREIYIAFISVASDFNLQLFDGKDKKKILKDVGYFRQQYDGDLEEAIDDKWDVTPPPRYFEALLRQLCSTNYSLQASTVGYVIPGRLDKLVRELNILVPELDAKTIEEIAIGFIEELLEDFAFDDSQEIGNSIRQKAAQYSRQNWGSKATFSNGMKKVFKLHFGWTDSLIQAVEDVLRKNLCQGENNTYFLDKNKLALRIDTAANWYQCQTCTSLEPVMIKQWCINCGSDKVIVLAPGSSEYIRSTKGFWREPVVKCLNGEGRPDYITAEEHTAQLSQRDTGTVFATTEKYELRFQDVIIGDDEGPVDILSCTTTMEVGVDIGSLVAVGLRNVPPQRENYQQRAGRAGRRGSAVSTVITFAQGGSHDNYYFDTPKEIVAGPSRVPVVKVNNEKIARRHIHAFLIQTFFQQAIDRGAPGVDIDSAVLFKALGKASDFFMGSLASEISLPSFDKWVKNNVLQSGADLINVMALWLPEGISDQPKKWLMQTTEELLERLWQLKKDYEKRSTQIQSSNVSAATRNIDRAEEIAEELNEDVEADLDDDKEDAPNDELLSFFFDNGLLPSYAFPTDLCSFVVQDWKRVNNVLRIVTKEKPQQSINKALTEYAPGREIVINKKTYRSGGVFSAMVLVSDPDRAIPLFRNVKRYVYCKVCTYVQDPAEQSKAIMLCPICHSQLAVADMIVPEVFAPEEGKEIDEFDNDQDLTYATSAQFPVPTGGDDLTGWFEIGKRGWYTYATDRKLIIVNKGIKDLDMGFHVCEKCGAATPADINPAENGKHKRPYLTSWKKGQQKRYECDGQFRTVFLGHTFLSDLLVIRITLTSPIALNMRSSITQAVLSDGLRTLSEALLLAASRYLDLDSTEFSTGFRLVPGNNENEQRADIYLFDTLSGGAGYAEQAGLSLEKILRDTEDILKNCKENCSSSCTKCLRNYQNQHWHYNLDRFLGLALLRYLLYGELPQVDNLETQEGILRPLSRLLVLDGYECMNGATMNGIVIPLMIKSSTSQLAVGTYHSILDENVVKARHPLHQCFASSKNISIKLLNEYFITHNLPGAYKLVKQALEE